MWTVAVLIASLCTLVAGPLASVPNEDAAQATKAVVDFSGTWVPEDAQRVQRWFEVGMARFPGSGVTITQDAKGITLSYRFSAFRGDEEVTVVYRFDGSESVNTGQYGPSLSGSEANRAKWDGNRLRISRRVGERESEDVYELQGQDLSVESGGRSAIVFHRQGR